MLELIFTGISVYSSHTSFDTSLGGNNDDLASRLGLRDVEELGGALGRTGYLAKSMKLKDLAVLLDEALDHPGGIKVAGDPETLVPLGLIVLILQSTGPSGVFSSSTV